MIPVKLPAARTVDGMRQLIVNADDFGLSSGVNRGIIEAGEKGIVTSASLMVRQPAAAAAAEYARRTTAISVGLHLDFGEWVFRNGEWVPLYSVVSTEDAAEVSDELARQLREFERLMGREPTHIDSHQHVHRQEPVRTLVTEAAQKLGIPLRDFTPEAHYCGDFYGQDGEGKPIPGALSLEGLTGILRSLPEGVTELGCHPGYADGLATAYRDERAIEVGILCAPGLREVLHQMGITLRSFENIIAGPRSTMSVT
jgi:predicted glycoside hydrolase/deacetylase ChbG (UPF0249 family)